MAVFETFEAIKSMIENIKHELESTVVPLLSGIVKDSQLLFRQELALAKSEASREIDKIKSAAIAGGSAGLCALISVVLLSFAIVHLLAELSAGLELWQCYALTAAVFALLAVAFYFKSKTSAADVDVTLPQTRVSIKEISHV